jgi:LysM repeat protein
LQKKLLRTRKEYGVSAEELKRANPFLEEEGLQIGHHYPFKDYYPKNHCENPSKNVVQKDTFIYHDVLAKETKYSIAKRYGITVEELENAILKWLIIYLLDTD